ncbi:hypothetical protein Aple_010780 [Acrocarpospora pleiomorpha]|uniref:Minor tail T domain-containing protein n=1 Tax=Acrocarpospora pleiomorpha TaxID=90975 RepID=A0A5M3XGT8_9ACTN|nr:DUF4035 domain-containing protein [Acrocarpospora pleiomorpha]GES18183.1 hypothetical protein Aple_010780 [Acrocarpospora pleiomorpha]
MRARPERAFYFRLASHLHMTVGRLLNEIGSRELTEWQVYERMAGPLGPVRDDYLAAQVAATVINVNRGKGKRARGIEAVRLRWDSREPVDPAELYSRVQKINARLGGNDIRLQPTPQD